MWRAAEAAVFPSPGRGGMQRGDIIKGRDFDEATRRAQRPSGTPGLRPAPRGAELGVARFAIGNAWSSGAGLMWRAAEAAVSPSPGRGGIQRGDLIP
jgi:hypothetical protein